MAPKSIWRGPNAQHFTLVHRSQQDPLLNDAEASNRVLKSTPKRHEANADSAGAAGQSRRQLEQALGAVAKGERKNVGEAANYGIMFDDTEYDYMQHLRAVGGNDNSRRGGKDEEDDEEVIMLEAPKARRSGKEKAKEGGTLEFKEQRQTELDLPQEVLPSQSMMPRTFEQDKQVGIQPDMDPHLRQILEALDDDAFLMKTADTTNDGAPASTTTKDEEASVQTIVDMDQEDENEEDFDDFFGEIVKGGQLEADEQEPEWRQLPPGGENDKEDPIYLDPSARAARELMQLRQEGKGMEDLSLESRVALFKKAAAEHREESKAKGTGSVAAPPSSVGSKSIFGEKGASRRSRHAGAKARLAASFYAPSIDGGATAFSMSSSAMERNQGLTKLDEQFARMERIYEDADDDEAAAEDENEAELANLDDDAVGGPENVDEIFDEFLSKNEVIGKRMRERLGAGADLTPAEKVDMIRRELGQVREVDRQTWDEAMAAGRGPTVSVEELISRDLAERKNARRAWDVETIRTTRTNVENHPRTIAASQSVAPSRISRIVPQSVKMNSDGGASDAGMSTTTDRMARIKIDPRTGRANVVGHINIGARQQRRMRSTADEGDFDDEPVDNAEQREDADGQQASDTESDDTIDARAMMGVMKRDRNESKDEKKARKQAAKEEKQARKIEKSQRKQQFKSALQRPAAASATLGSNAASISLR